MRSIRPGAGVDLFYGKKALFSAEVEEHLRRSSHMTSRIRFLFRDREETLRLVAEGGWQELWKTPLRAAALGGRKDYVQLALHHKANERLSFDLTSYGARLELRAESPNLSASPEGREWKASLEASYLLHSEPYLTVTVGYRHFGQEGDGLLFQLLPLLDQSDLFSARFYFAHQWEKHWRLILSASLGTDPTREIDLVFFHQTRLEFRPHDRFLFWLSNEWATESQQAETGGFLALRGGVTIYF